MKPTMESIQAIKKMFSEFDKYFVYLKEHDNVSKRDKDILSIEFNTYRHWTAGNQRKHAENLMSIYTKHKDLLMEYTKNYLIFRPLENVNDISTLVSKVNDEELIQSLFEYYNDLFTYILDNFYRRK